MRAIIIGAGKVGFNIGQILSNENHDVVIIEKDEERCKIVQENLDVQVINGTGASSQVLEEADIKNADLLIAVTEYDELNMIACILAKQYGVPRTIARVRNPEYADNNLLTKSSVLGIDLLINPEKVTAWEISQLIDVPEALDVEYYADGKIQMLELEIDDTAPVINKHLKDLNIPYRFVIVAILRDEKMIIPRGNDIIKKGDIIFLLAKTTDMVDIEKYMGKKRAKTKNVMILGGGRIGYYLAKLLEAKRMNVKIIEKKLERCKEISKSLDTTLVLHGDGSDIDLLKEEGAGQVDAFVALTEDDKLNLLVSLLAKHLGVKKTIAQIRRSDYLPLVERVGIDVAVSPRLITASAILKFIRRGHIISVSLLSGDKAEMIELAVSEDSKVVNKYLRDLNFPTGAIIGSIYRDHDVFIPTGSDYILPNDRVVVFALPKAIHKVEAFFSE
ncbi:MAG: Trk system potassium transporter TrkA [Clostridia bacterium]|nr:Trk system potassium transporter TrkA [Clostridia bacterium]